MVANFIDADNNRWNHVALQEMFMPISMEEICKLELPLSQVQDKLLWLGGNEGRFSVKTSYDICNRDDNLGAISGVWKNIWRSKLYEGLKMFLWKLASQSLPTRLNLWAKLKKGDSQCVLCVVEEEYEIHMFMSCPTARALAFASKWGLKLDTVACSNPKGIVEWSLIFTKVNYIDMQIVAMGFLLSVWSWRNNVLFGSKSNVANVVND